MVKLRLHTSDMKICEMVCYIAIFICVVYVDDCLFWEILQSDILYLSI